MIAAIVLAAGSSTRMGRPKQLLPLADGTLLSTVLLRLLATTVDRVVVVLGHEADAIRRGAGIPPDPRVTIVENPRHLEGIASSLRCGLATCADAEAVLVALGDQPGIETAVVERLLAASRGGAPLAVPVHDEERGHPVLFGRSLFPALLALRGDVGARDVVARHWPDAVKVEGARPVDIDTPEDYESYPARRTADPRGRGGER